MSMEGGWAAGAPVGGARHSSIVDPKFTSRASVAENKTKAGYHQGRVAGCGCHGTQCRAGLPCAKPYGTPLRGDGTRKRGDTETGSFGVCRATRQMAGGNPGSGTGGSAPRPPSGGGGGVPPGGGGGGGGVPPGGGGGGVPPGGGRDPNPSQTTSASTSQALDAAGRWLGPNYRELGRPGSGVFRSADGLRQFRMAPNDLAPHDDDPHVHFEFFEHPNDQQPSENLHLYFEGGAP